MENILLTLVVFWPWFLWNFISVQSFRPWSSLGVWRKHRFLVEPYFCWVLTQGFLIFPDSVYVTVLDGRERNVSTKMCSPVNLRFQEKVNFSLSNSPFAFSDSVEWWRPMKELGTTPSENINTQQTESQELPWVKTKIWFLSWWLTRRYFQLLIISVVGYKEKPLFWKWRSVFGNAVWNGDVSFTVTRNKTSGRGGLSPNS